MFRWGQQKDNTNIARITALTEKLQGVLHVSNCLTNFQVHILKGKCSTAHVGQIYPNQLSKNDAWRT